MSALFIIIGLGAFAALCWRQLWWGTIALIALVPLYLVRFTLVVIPTTFLEACIYLAAAIWLIRVLQKKISLTAVTTFWRWCVPLWLVVGFVAVVVSPDRTEALGIWKAYFLDAALFFVIALTTLTDIPKLYRAVWAAGSVVLVLSLVAVWQALGLLPSPEPWISQSPPRVASVYEYPNALALFVVPLIGLCLPAALGVGGWNGRRRRFAWAVVTAGTVATIMAVSQGAWFGIAAAALVALLQLPRRWKSIGALVVLAAALFLIPTVRHHLVELITFHDTSGDVRLKLWQGTIRLLQDHPIEGAGLTGFPTLYDIYRDASHIELLLYPHNIFLNFWATLGLPGLVASVVLLVHAFTRLFRTRTGGELEPFRVGVLAALVALIVHGLVDVPYFKNDLAILFWFLIVLSERIYRLNKNS